MNIPPELIRKRRCTRCVCPTKNHKANVADGLYGEKCWGDFYDVKGKPDPWHCWTDTKHLCKGCDAVLRDIITPKL